MNNKNNYNWTWYGNNPNILGPSYYSAGNDLTNPGFDKVLRALRWLSRTGAVDLLGYGECVVDGELRRVIGYRFNSKRAYTKYGCRLTGIASGCGRGLFEPFKS